MLHYSAVDYAGNETNEVLKFIIDKESPVTTSIVEGVVGSEGWYLSDTSVSLISEDYLSGIGKTEYRINDGEWVVYSDTIILTDGIYTIEYRSIDTAGNVEEIQEIEIKVDTKKPTLDVSISPEIINSKNHKLVNVKAQLEYNDNLSGVVKVELLSISSAGHQTKAIKEVIVPHNQGKSKQNHIHPAIEATEQ